MEAEPRRSIAQLAVAVMTADGRITPSEKEASRRLDALGLGPLSALVDEEILRAMREPIDVPAACAALAGVPQAAPMIVAALADLAVCDRELAASEIEILALVATKLGLTTAQAAETIKSAVWNAGLRPTRAASTDGRDPGVTRVAEIQRDGSKQSGERSARLAGPSDVELAQAYRVLGLEPGATTPRLDRAYLTLVDRYNPAKVVDLGADFVALAVRRLAEATAAFEAIRDVSQ